MLSDHENRFFCPSCFCPANDRIRAHFLICFLALFIYRLLEKKLERKYTCEELLSTLRDYEFADVQGQGFIPIYESTKLTDALHEVAGFETDYEFLTKRKMKEIQKRSKQISRKIIKIYSPYLIQKKDYIVKRNYTAEKTK